MEWIQIFLWQKKTTILSINKNLEMSWLINLYLSRSLCIIVSVWHFLWLSFYPVSKKREYYNIRILQKTDGIDMHLITKMYIY